MTDVIIVDNSPIAFLFQPENAIPCISWYDDMKDTELDRIATILEKLAYEDDVRRIIKSMKKQNSCTWSLTREVIHRDKLTLEEAKIIKTNNKMVKMIFS